MKTSPGLPLVLIRHVSEFDLALSSKINKACHYNFIRHFFRIISRLGDGVFWYVLMLVLPIYYGSHGLLVSGHMLLSAGVALLIYKIIKSNTSRLRPFEYDTGIMQGTIALDKYSFPSGHTLQAVCFSIVAMSHFPHFAAILVPFTILIAASRVVLGLHYPTDVLAGAFIGGFIAYSSMLVSTFI